jgi:hypothetical protein
MITPFIPLVAAQRISSAVASRSCTVSIAGAAGLLVEAEAPLVGEERSAGAASVLRLQRGRPHDLRRTRTPHGDDEMPQPDRSGRIEHR